MEITDNISYAIGLIATDGYLSKDRRHIDFTSKDLEQINNFKNIFKLKNKIGIKYSGRYNDKCTYYRVQFGNVVFYKYLLSIGLTNNKSKTIKSVKIPRKYFSDFLRGNFDGDGFSYSYWDKRWKSSFMLYLGFSSASYDYLSWLNKKIQTYYKIIGIIKTSGRKSFNLVFAKNASIKLYKIIYYHKDLICLSRKRFKIESALDIISKQAGMAKLVHAYA